MPARQNQRRADHGCAIGQTPSAGVVHRRGRQHAIDRANAEHLGGIASVGMQHRRAVAVEHAFRAPSGARGVAKRARRVFVELRPGIVLVRLGQQRLITIKTHARRECDILHAGRVGQEHDSANAGTHRRRDLGKQRGKGSIREENAILRVGHDERDVLRRQARVHRMADRAHAGDAIIEFEVTEIVPGERRHAIPEADAELSQRARQPPAAPLDLGIGGSMERRTAKVRDHFRSAAMTGGVDDERGDQQRVALHQSEHRSLPQFARPCACAHMTATLPRFGLFDNPRSSRARKVIRSQNPIDLLTRSRAAFRRREARRAPPALR